MTDFLVNIEEDGLCKILTWGPLRFARKSRKNIRVEILELWRCLKLSDNQHLAKANAFWTFEYRIISWFECNNRMVRFEVSQTMNRITRQFDSKCAEVQFELRVSCYRITGSFPSKSNQKATKKQSKNGQSARKIILLALQFESNCRARGRNKFSKTSLKCF